MDNQKLQDAIITYKHKQQDDPEAYERDISERLDRVKYYQEFSKERILAMSEEDLYEYISNLWSMIIWGNKQYVVDKLIEENGLEKIKKSLVSLLYSNAKIEDRWTSFLKDVKGLGPSSVSELLLYSDPNEYCILNSTTTACFNYLAISGVPKYNYQYTGDKYVEICQKTSQIAKALENYGFADVDNLLVDYFLWDAVLPYAEKPYSHDPAEQSGQDKGEPKTNAESKSFHNEMVDKIVAIGELLGFQSDSEVKVAKGAVVDVVWEVNIGNMGKVIYVFEVQSHGSKDSLILNLAKAKNNSAVQAIVAVSDAKQLASIREESTGVIDDRLLRSWEFDDVSMVYESLVRAHESINALGLVPDSFRG